MRHVSILVPRGHSSVVNIGGTHQILSLVNEMLVGMGRKPVFDVHLVGLDEARTGARRVDQAPVPVAERAHLRQQRLGQLPDVDALSPAVFLAKPFRRAQLLAAMEASTAVV